MIDITFGRLPVRGRLEHKGRVAGKPVKLPEPALSNLTDPTIKEFTPMLKPLFIALCLATAAMTPAAAAYAEKAPIYTEAFSSVAVGGYDAVSYFSGKPAKGDGAHSTEYQGATWRFLNAENLASFKANPARYAPQYGGYCAWAAAQGYTAKGNPKNWRVVDGKLYLNYNDDIQTKWEADISGFISQADKNWPALLKK